MGTVFILIKLQIFSIKLRKRFVSVSVVELLVGQNVKGNSMCRLIRKSQIGKDVKINWFKRYRNVKWLIANGLVLPSGEVPLGRACYQRGYSVYIL